MYGLERTGFGLFFIELNRTVWCVLVCLLLFPDVEMKYDFKILCEFLSLYNIFLIIN